VSRWSRWRQPRSQAGASAGLEPARLSLVDLARVASVGLRTRRLRAGLSALGIAIGVAAIVAVLGLSSSSQAGLLDEIDRLGTNLLTVTKGQSFTGEDAPLPLTARSMIERIAAVEGVADTAAIEQADVYRSPLIPSIETNGLQVQAASLDLLPVIATRVAEGDYLNAATAREPVAVLGAAAAERLGIDRVYEGERVWLGGQWFYVAGILEPAALADEIDASVLVGYPAARRCLDYTGLADGKPTAGPPSTIYVRAETGDVDAVQSLLAQTANPEAPNEAEVSQPSDALTARAAAESALNGLFLGLGAVALLVGAVGVANIMVISVLERRSEIGLRRALGATRAQIRTQFLAEAIVLALLGGTAGVLTGALATVIYASTRDWSAVIPAGAWAGGIAAALAIGAIAGLLPALRAARVSPTEALRSV
jgi:putative ABC transport system permease protein